MNEGLASLRSSLFRVSQAHAIAFRRTRGLKRRGEASSPFHKRYSRAKFAVSRYANLAVCLSGCLLPSVVKDRSRGNCSRNLRSRRSAGPVWSRRCEKSSKTNKKPGDERRANPSISLGVYSVALGRMCSKLVFFLPGIRNQPHLWISRQARSVSRLPHESGLHQHRASIAKSKIPSSSIQDFFTVPSQFRL